MHASTEKRSVSAIVVGCSAGGVDALRILLRKLPAGFPYPLFVTIHRDGSYGDRLADLLNIYSKLEVVTPDDKEVIRPDRVYVAPGDYHMLIERTFVISLSTDPPVNHCRPSVDVMFETAAWAYGEGLVGVILTGANEDGSLGMKEVKDCGGFAIVQSPQTAAFPTMPESAIEKAPIDLVLDLEEIGNFLAGL